MAKILIFLRPEWIDGEAKSYNNEFREIVKNFVPFIVKDKISIAEYMGRNAELALSENTDCQIVFAYSYDSENMSVCCAHNKFVFSWYWCTSKKLVPTFVTKDTFDGITYFSSSHYGLNF